MRSKYDAQLLYLHEQLGRMGQLCEEAIANATKAIFSEEPEFARTAAKCEEAIDQKEREIEALCMQLLLQQQPVATDLRRISTAIKMISDMERIGDQAADIAFLTLENDIARTAGDVHLKDMARATIQMVNESVAAYVAADGEKASAVIQMDDKVDALFLEIKSALVDLVRADGDAAENVVNLLMIAKYFERIGDHAVNVAEWVLFSITGRHVKKAPASETD